MIKHRLKGVLRGLYSGFVVYTGAWRLFDRLSRRRLVILAGHCVGDVPGLPGDMTLSEGRLREIIAALSKRFDWATVGEGVALVDSGGSGRSLAALSFDDGYRDNFEVLLPILEETGAKATVFLEGRPLAEGRASWSHQFFWLLHVAKVPVEELARELVERGDPELAPMRLEEALQVGDRLEYRVKRVLKYDCDARVRDWAIGEIFENRGGRISELCRELYMDAGAVRALKAGGVELGGHTFRHEVLSTLTEQEAEQDIRLGRDAMARVLGEELSGSFAYPFGRRWDFRQVDREAVARAGYDLAVTTHPGVVDGRGDRFRLPRLMVEEGTPIREILCEASGAYGWLRRLGLDLTE